MAITPFKVTNFGTNQKPIYDFLLVINSTNLPSILHRFQVKADYVKFSLRRGGRYNLTPSLVVIPCEYAHK